MGAFVLGLGLLLFNREMLDRFVEPPYAPEVAPIETRQPWEPEWVAIPAGTYTSGPPGNQELADCAEPFLISRYEVPNRLWKQFLDAEAPRLRTRPGFEFEDADPGPRAGWERDPDGTPRPSGEELDRPVRNVTAVAAALFCEWLTQRLQGDDPTSEIRLPTRAEWEYAARGRDGRLYPWGDEYERPAPRGTGSDEPSLPRNVQQQWPTSVDGVDDDTSPFGVDAMGTNVSEFAISSAPLRLPPRGPSWERLVDVIENRIVIVYRCGASFGDPHERAKVLAQTWNTTRDNDPRLPFTNVGIRLVKVKLPE
jgi:serine/threonine-protein kinase